MSTDSLRIATRKSPLALWQAEHVRGLLQAAHPGLRVELLKMSTRGDRVLDSPLAKVGGKGLFVKELEQAILEDRADIAVHSMKDVPAALPHGLCIGAVLEREDPRDALVAADFTSIGALPHGARVGTSSLRRQCQLLEIRPDLQIGNLRGNVGTRLSKLEGGDYDAIVLACAGLKRLGMGERLSRGIAPAEMLPAIAQGVIGIECRDDDARVAGLIEPLAHAETTLRTRAERAMNAALAGGCQAPVAGYCELNNGLLEMRGLVGWPDGSKIIRASASAPPGDAESMGRALAEDLLSRGAGPILEALLNSD